MRRDPSKGDIRIVGADEARRTGPPRLPVLIAVGVLAAAATAVVLFTDDGADLATRIPDLTLASASTTAPPPTIAGDLGGGDNQAPPVPNPLDTLVPGFHDTLVLTVATADGVEVWTWTSGPQGTLVRDQIGPDLYDPIPDASGETVAALREYAHDQPWLVATHGADVVPVFYGAQSFAWHRTEPGDIAWLAQLPGEDSPILYVGSRNDGGLYFQPVGVLPDFDALGTGPFVDRIVGYDDAGFVVERWSLSDTEGPQVIWLDSRGNTFGGLPGTFVGLSGDGLVAVSSASAGFGTSTIIYSVFYSELGPVVESGSQQPAIQALTSSMAWWTGGTSLAYTPAEGHSVVVLSGGSAMREYDLGIDRPIAAAWSPDGRFLVATGSDGDTPMLLFVDMADGSIDAVAIDASPVGAVIVP